MSDGTGYVLYRRAFCLLWEALYHFQLQAVETGVCLEQIQPRNRERFPVSSLVVRALVTE